MVARLVGFVARKRRSNISFFECVYARFLWCVVHIIFGIAPPLNIEDLFHQWLQQGGQNLKLYFLTGAAALC